MTMAMWYVCNEMSESINDKNDISIIINDTVMTWYY